MTRPASADAHSQSVNNDRAVGLWLLACCAMIFAMAVIGAVTRLTESGLSIMEWAPVAGALPPLGAAEWERVFALYRQIPEYREWGGAMSLAEFKTIFWWEYVHRLWGRLIGVVFLVPFLWFLLRRRLRPGLAPHLVVMFGLGGLQGALGWYMVASGFAERTDVSQYRLVAHLGAAVAIYAYILWIALGLLVPRPSPSPDARTAGLRALLIALSLLVLIAMASGGFVAGLNAGLVFNTFPLMDGDLVPAGYGRMEPWPVNLFENQIAVQFNHRALAVASAAAAVLAWLWSRRLRLSPRARGACTLVLAMALAQFGLGVATLLLVVPVGLAALHQAGALALLTLTLWAIHVVRAAPGAAIVIPAGKAD
ncbi:MAG: COX15/CtaA family protein [Proteobacteria bacterium]|nr:COX15/CtaA family protein [Pseudomonadota bacterium]